MPIVIGRSPHSLTLAEFLGQAPVRTDIYVSGAESCNYTVFNANLKTAQSAADIPGFDALDLQALEDYIFCERKDQPTDFLAFYEDGLGEMTVIGEYIAENLFVEQEHRNKGVASILVFLAAGARGGATRAIEYTPAGWRAHRRAHRLAVEAALHSGSIVRDEVLMDYPDLATRASRR